MSIPTVRSPDGENATGSGLDGALSPLVSTKSRDARFGVRITKTPAPLRETGAF